MSEDDNLSDELKDIIDTADEVVEQHGDLIDSVAESMEIHLGGLLGDITGGYGDEKTIQLDDRDRLREVTINEDSLEILVNVTEVESFDVTVKYVDYGLVISYHDEEIKIKDAPDDLLINQTEVKMNNGVLTVDIPRSNDDDSSVTVEGGEI